MNQTTNSRTHYPMPSNRSPSHEGRDNGGLNLSHTKPPIRANLSNSCQVFSPSGVKIITLSYCSFNPLIRILIRLKRINPHKNYIRLSESKISAYKYMTFPTIPVKPGKAW
jgi:hypothetical protein